MAYEYYNMFAMTNELEEILTKLINKKEKGNYICKVITATIPKHKEEAYGYTGSVAGLRGAEIAYINKKYGHFYEIDVPTQHYYFIVVMETMAYHYFKKFSFNSTDEINNALKALSLVFKEYDGYSFNPTFFYKKFPYLKSFFESLDEWRAERNRVTIDDEVLERCANKTLKL